MLEIQDVHNRCAVGESQIQDQNRKAPFTGMSTMRREGVRTEPEKKEMPVCIASDVYSGYR